MKKYPAFFLIPALCILWLIFSVCIAAASEEDAETEIEDTLTLTLDKILEQSDQQALEDLLSDSGLPDSVTFFNLVRGLMTGRIPFQLEEIRTYVTDLFFFRDPQPETDGAADSFDCALLGSLFQFYPRV